MALQEQVIPAVEVRKSRNPLTQALIFVYGLARKKPLGAFGALIVIAFIFMAAFADFIAPYGYLDTHFQDALAPPSARYTWGTDALGRDMLSRVIYGARISLYVAFGAVAVRMLFATLLGLTSGYFMGRLDLIVQRFADAWASFPTLVIQLVILGIIGQGLEKVIFVLSLHFVTDARLLRAAVISLREEAYVEAGRAIGASHWRIIFRHILPNLIPLMIVLASIEFGHMILAEGTLSFLGFGVPPPHPSWGGMVGSTARVYMTQAPWMAIFPGLALTLAVFGFNVFGDAVRDLLDPRLRGGAGRFQ